MIKTPRISAAILAFITAAIIAPPAFSAQAPARYSQEADSTDSVLAVWSQDPQDATRNVSRESVQRLLSAGDSAFIHTDFSRRSPSVSTAMLRWAGAAPRITISRDKGFRVELTVSGVMAEQMPWTFMRKAVAQQVPGGVRFSYEGLGELRLSVKENAHSAIIRIWDSGANNPNAIAIDHPELESDVAPVMSRPIVRQAVASITQPTNQSIAAESGDFLRKATVTSAPPPVASKATTSELSGWKVLAANPRAAVVAFGDQQYPVKVGSALPNAGSVIAIDLASRTVTTTAGTIVSTKSAP